jgi:hypothetical protein
VSQSENLRRRGDKHWFGTFHFDRWFVLAESVREIRVETDSNFLGQTQHSFGTTGTLLSWHGSLRLLADPPLENAAEKGSIWVTRRQFHRK